MAHALQNFAKLATRAAQRFMVSAIATRHKTYQVENVLSTNEIINYKELFDKMDSDKDGQLTKEDLRSGLENFLNYKASEEELDETMRTLDDKQTGTINFDDFLGSIAWSRHKKEEDSIKNTFETFDKNKDGLMNIDELREALASLGVKPDESLLNNIMMISGGNNNGNITFEQFREFFYNKNPLK